MRARPREEDGLPSDCGRPPKRAVRSVRHINPPPFSGSEHHEDLLMGRHKVVNGGSFW